jgi:hypothetical protein
MGGNALKHTITERKTTEQFYQIANKILPILRKELNTTIDFVEFYKNKETHGDIDLLVKMTNKHINIDLKEVIIKLFNPNEIITNDGTVSFDYDKFQIDICYIKEDVYDNTKFWMNFDPTSNLIGKISHKFGLKYGMDCLFYPYRGRNGRVMHNIFLTKDNRRILEFLGFDYDKKAKGFDTLEEIYDWTINSKYFNPEFFQLDNLTQKDRKRNKKRPTFTKFIEYVKDFKYESEGYNFEKNKTKYLDFIDECFPEVNFLKQINECEEIDNFNNVISDKFNGNIIMNKYPNLKGKELGDAIYNLKKQFKNDDDYKQYIYDTDVEKIFKLFNNVNSKSFLSINQ